MIRRIFGRTDPDMAPPAPDLPFTAISDIHGRADLLSRALEGLEGLVVCVGDYVDRGPDSADVLEILQTRADTVCLMGNHEDMLLNFLDDPDRHGPRWLRYGGMDTLRSFGVDALGAQDGLPRVRDDFRKALGSRTETWLRGLASLWQSGTVAVTHAGADPALPLERQDSHVLRWGHPAFGRTRRRDGIWVLRGHVVVDAPMMQDGIIQIDTGAWHTGHLTLAHMSAQQVAFTQT